MNNLNETMKMTEEEMSETLLRTMTVDMSIDFWQTKECAMGSVDIILQHVLNSVEFSDNEVSEENLNQRAYWRRVKELLKSK